MAIVIMVNIFNIPDQNFVAAKIDQIEIMKMNILILKTFVIITILNDLILIFNESAITESKFS